MKLLPRPPKNVRVNTEDSLGHGMDAVIMLAMFLGAGFGLDRLFGTMPVFMIVMTVSARSASSHVLLPLRGEDERARRAAIGEAPAPTDRPLRWRRRRGGMTVAAAPDVDILGPASMGRRPKSTVSKDMIKRGLIVAPLIVAVCA